MVNSAGQFAGNYSGGEGRRMKPKTKVGKVMGEFKRGTLRSGSKKGPKVKKRKQAVAIAMNEAGMSKGRTGKRRMPEPMSDQDFGSR